MKKLLYFIFFSGIFFATGAQANAQSMREPVQQSQKMDDGVLVAYPNPARDFIIVKAKDPNIKIKAVAFYSILGQQVAQITVNMNSGEINLDKLRPGKYLMRYILEDGTQKITQIIKQ